ncbi:MAG: hypothetical protein MI921_01625 [Cytophagales bacterium]|nr:hypothetical protein [Cytophagales bacterium]
MPEKKILITILSINRITSNRVFFRLALAISLVVSLISLSETNSIQKYGQFTSGCSLGTLNEVACGIEPWVYGSCTVTLGFQTVDAYNSINMFGQCSERLYKRNP